MSERKSKKKQIKPKKPALLPYSLRDVLDYYPISEAAAFDAAGVHRTTWQRWLNGISKPPRATVQLIRSLALGNLPDPAFNGFTCHSGLLLDDTNTGYTPADIRSIPFFRSGHARYVSALRQIEQLQRDLNAITASYNAVLLTQTKAIEK